MSPQSHNLELQTATISLVTTARLNSFETSLSTTRHGLQLATLETRRN